MSRLPSCAPWVLLFLCLVTTSRSDDPPAKAPDQTPPVVDESAAPLSSTIVRLKTVEAATVAKVLENLGVKVLFAVDPRTNSLVLRGSDEDLKAVLAVVQNLDEFSTPDFGRQIVTEVVVLEVAPGERSTTKDDLQALIDAPAPSERVRSRRSYQVRGVENQDAQLQVGGSQYVADSEQLDPRFGGRSPRSYRNEAVGTILRVTGKESPPGRIMLTYTYESSGFSEPRPPAEDGTSPPGKETVSLTSTVSVRPGEPIVLASSDTQAAASGSKLLILARSSFVED